MADSSVPITAGTGTNIDTRTESINGDHRQVVVIGDPVTGANVISVNSNGSMPTQGYQPTATTFSAVSTTGALASTSVNGLNVATVTLRTFTGTGPSITFKLQASDDNTNWVDLQGINNSTGLVASTFTQGAALTAGTAGPSIDFTVGAYSNVRINVTAISGTTPVAAFGLGLQSMPYEASPGAIAQGTVAAGSAIAGNPVLIGGSDGTNARALKTNTTGQPDIRPLTTADAVTASIAAAQTIAVTQATAASLNATVVNAAGTALMGKVGIDQTTPGTTNGVQVNAALPTGTNSIGTVQPGNTANTTAWLVTNPKSTTGTITSVTAAAVSTTILASNANRIGASVYNDSTAILYLSTSATAASTTVYSVQVPPGGYYELPNTRLYTGQLTGIWSSATGAARVTELT